MNVEWALKEINDCRTVLVEISKRLKQGHNDPFTYVTSSDEMVLLKEHFLGHDVALQQIAAELGMAKTWAMSNSTHRYLEVLAKMEAHLKRTPEIEEQIGPRGPRLAASSLHPWVWDAAASYWDQRAFDLSVREAARALDLHLQAKLGRRDTHGVTLMQQAFSLNAPTEDQPRLRFHGNYNEQTWKDLHAGAMKLGEAMMLAVRNAATHEDLGLDSDHALEQLAALSLLARWIDQAEVVGA